MQKSHLNRSIASVGKRKENVENIRNPWRSQSPECMSSGTSSSGNAASRYTARRAPWHCGPHREAPHLTARYYPQVVLLHQGGAHSSHHPSNYPVYRQYLVDDLPTQRQSPITYLSDVGVTQPPSSPAGRPANQTSSDGSSRPGARSCHYYCSYFLQALFICGIMAGSSIAIAGAVYHNQRGKLLVLVYIGALVTIVCLVLLLIQCCDTRHEAGSVSPSYSTNLPTQSAMRFPEERTPESIPLQLSHAGPPDLESTFMSHRYDVPSEVSIGSDHHYNHHRPHVHRGVAQTIL